MIGFANSKQITNGNFVPMFMVPIYSTLHQGNMSFSSPHIQIPNQDLVEFFHGKTPNPNVKIVLHVKLQVRDLQMCYMGIAKVLHKDRPFNCI